MKLKLARVILLVYILINILMPISISAKSLNVENFEKLSIDDGLSNEYVTSMFQDSKGYMWIGTKDGLNRYDGERIKVYNCSIDSNNALSSTYINAIEEDYMGNIWVATDAGLDIIEKDTENIVNMNNIKLKNHKLANLKITSLLSNLKEEIMWVGTENGLVKIDIKNNKIEAVNNDNKENSYITCLQEDESNNLWVGTTNGMYTINKDTLEINSYEDDIYNSIYIYNIELDKTGNMWISTKVGIFVYNLKEDKKNEVYIIDNEGIREYKIKENKINIIHSETFKNTNIYNNDFILNDSNNNMWISSSSGINIYSPSENKFLHYNKESKYESYLVSDNITCFYEDFNGTIWIGTDKGINILNVTNHFNYINNYNYEEGNLNDKSIVSIIQHNGYYWLATKFDGIYLFDDETDKLVDIIYLNSNEKLDISNEYIKCLFKVNDNILVTTNKESVLLNKNGTIVNKFLSEDGYNIELNYIYNDEYDKDIVWFANTSDFRNINIQTGKITSYKKDLERFNINPGKITYILPDNKDENILWLGGEGIGLVKYHKKNGVILKYEHNPSDKNSLINNNINCMKFDYFGNLWIGTNIGLSKLNTKTNKFTSYTTNKGLTNNFINSIEVDDYNNLWISTNNGISKLDIEKESITNFTKMDGVHGYQFNINSSCKDKNGIIGFGSTSGTIYFNPKDIKNPTPKNQKVVFGDIFVDKNKVIYNGNELVLEHNHKNLSIEYFLPVYENINNITYEYMIEGIDSNWIYTDSNGSLDIKSLSPGKYILKVRARDGHNNLTKETSMNIKVKKPIWKTDLAYLIYIILFIIITFYIANYVAILQRLVKNKTMKLNNQLEENKKLSEEIIQSEKFKNKYFVNLSHELRTPINVISSTIQLTYNMIENETITVEKAIKYIEIINRNCNNLLKIINEIIDSAKIETGNYKITKKNNDIVYIVEETALNMINFIENKGLSLLIDPEIEEKIISFDEVEIERCIINLLGNAVKFTPEGGKIKVYIKEIEGYIEITIEDSGIGISKEDQAFIFKKFVQVEGNGATKASSSGIGLTLVKHIVDLHNGYIKLESDIGKGSKFTIGLPDIYEEITSKNTQ